MTAPRRSPYPAVPSRRPSRRPSHQPFPRSGSQEHLSSSWPTRTHAHGLARSLCRNHFIFAYKEETEQQYQELRTLLLGGSVPAAISTASTAEAPRGPQVPDASFKSSSAALAAETSKFAGAKLVGATSNWGAGGGAMMAHDDVVPITSSPPSPSADETPPPILGEGAEFLQGSLSRASPSEGLRA